MREAALDAAAYRDLQSLKRWMEAHNALHAAPLDASRNTLAHAFAAHDFADGLAALLCSCPSLATAANVEGRLPLHVACVLGCSAALQALLLAAPAALLVEDKGGLTPLQLAIRAGNVASIQAIFKTVINAAAAVPAVPSTSTAVAPSFLAACLELVRGTTTKLLAAADGLVSSFAGTASLPLSSSADIATALLTAVAAPHPEASHNALHAAALCASPAPLQTLLSGLIALTHVLPLHSRPLLSSLATSIDKDGNTPLHLAATEGGGGAHLHLLVLALLDTHSPLDVLGARNARGQTPLLLSVQEDLLEALQPALAAAAVHAAAGGGGSKGTKAAVAAFTALAAIATPDANGLTPLHAAAAARNDVAAAALLSAAEAAVKAAWQVRCALEPQEAARDALYPPAAQTTASRRSSRSSNSVVSLSTVVVPAAASAFALAGGVVGSPSSASPPLASSLPFSSWAAPLLAAAKAASSALSPEALTCARDALGRTPAHLAASPEHCRLAFQAVESGAGEQDEEVEDDDDAQSWASPCAVTTAAALVGSSARLTRVRSRLPPAAAVPLTAGGSPLEAAALASVVETASPMPSLDEQSENKENEEDDDHMSRPTLTPGLLVTIAASPCALLASPPPSPATTAAAAAAAGYDCPSARQLQLKAYAILKLLHKAGASLSARDAYNQTPYDVAQANNQPLLAAYLVEATTSPAPAAL